MFITKKALQRRIEEGIAKERERVAQRDWIEGRLRDNFNEIEWFRQNYDKRLWEMDDRIRKLEGKKPDEVRVYENA